MAWQELLNSLNEDDAALVLRTFSVQMSRLAAGEGLVQRALIILDVDGVLNPQVSHGSEGTQLHLTEERTSLLRDLADLGEIVWGSTWGAEALNSLSASAGLAASSAIGFTAGTDPEAPTPKLARVRRWVELRELMEEFDWDALVWIDDSLREDALSWLDGLKLPALGVAPEPAVGLIAEHFEAVEAFLRR